jgi:hypothetical protein
MNLSLTYLRVAGRKKDLTKQSLSTATVTQSRAPRLTVKKALAPKSAVTKPPFAIDQGETIPEPVTMAKATSMTVKPRAAESLASTRQPPQKKSSNPRKEKTAAYTSVLDDPLAGVDSSPLSLPTTKGKQPVRKRIIYDDDIASNAEISGDDLDTRTRVAMQELKAQSRKKTVLQKTVPQKRTNVPNLQDLRKPSKPSKIAQKCESSY